MEGPTPVSALIHAATMVTAGVYLIARMHPLFELAPTAADISAAIGALTLVFAASVALVVTDLKRIIAYSTISQIGYMVMGVSIAAYGAGHVPPHDARLLQGADVHGRRLGDRRDGGQQNIDRMSGLRRAMPFTFVAFLVAALALAAFPGFSGYFSKDEILAFAAERGGGYWILYVVGHAGGADDRLLRVPDGVPRLRRRAERGGARARAAATCTTPSPSTRSPASRRTPTSATPGPSTTSPSASAPMRLAMAILAVLSVFGGVAADPRASRTSSRTSSTDLRGLALRRRRGLGRHRGARAGGRRGSRRWPASGWRGCCTCARPARPLRLARAASAACTGFLAHKWYFDELYDRAGRAAACGRSARGRRTCSSAS